MKAYRIEFEPARHGRARPVEGYKFTSPDAARAEAEQLNSRKIAAWNGTFYAIDFEGNRI